MRKFLLGTAIVVFAVGAILVPHQAEAWWRGGGGGFYYGPPVFVGPPVIYVPGPVYGPAPVYAPPQQYAPAGQACYAGAYVCPLDRPTQSGAPCSCPTNQGRAYGRAQ